MTLNEFTKTYFIFATRLNKCFKLAFDKYVILQVTGTLTRHLESFGV